MIQICMFSGHEGVVRAEKKIYITIFGGCELVRPTVAKRIIARRQQQTAESSTKPPMVFFFTLFGCTEIKTPTLAEEFLDLRQALDSRALTLEEWDRAMAELSQLDVSISSLTLFAGFGECELPEETEEIDALALQRHLGNISDKAGQVLQFAIGQRQAERTATIRRAAVA